MFLSVKVDRNCSMFFHKFHKRNLCHFLFASHSKVESTLKRKNLLLLGQILSRADPIWRGGKNEMAESLPLKVCQFNLKYTL